MAHEFNAEEKEVKEFADRIGFGVHKVQLVSADAGTTTDDKDFIELNIISEDGIEDSARLWFTGGASNISFNTLRQILVHSVKDEAKKAVVRDAVDAAKDTDELVTYLNKAAGCELWLTKYYDPKRTYQNAQGQTRKSINTNVYGYEPKLKPELMPPANTGPVDLGALGVGQQVPFESDGDAPGSTVPSDDAWAK